MPDFEAIKLGETPDYTEYDWEGAKVKLPKDVEKNYREALRKDLPLKFRFKQFLTASNKAGKRAKVVKDFILIFTPFGSKIEKVTELIAHQIRRTMPETKKPKSTSKTIITFSLLLIVSVLSHFGIDLGLDLSPDAAWLGTATSIVGIILRLVTNKPVELGAITQRLLGQSNN